MQCPKCHEKINRNEERDVDHQTQMKRPMPRWFKLAIFITLTALCVVSGGLLFTESLLNFPQKQLSALRENEIETAYQDFTSAHFKASISLEQFRHFVETYPILVTNHSALFPQRSIAGDITILKGKLLADDQSTTTIEYRLIKEEGKWKILSINFPKSQSQNKAEKKKIIQITRSLLKEIQEGDIQSSYEMYFSDDFKATTSLEDFKNLIRQNPLLTQDYQVSFHKPIIKDDEGTVSVVLKADHQVIYFKNKYIKDKSIWKILSFRILSPTIADKQAS